MHLEDRFIVRRTISQERFEVLWKKRVEAELTLKELAEMDEIINRDPLILKFVLKEMETRVSLPNDGDRQNMLPQRTSQLQVFIYKLKSFFRRSTSFVAVN